MSLEDSAHADDGQALDGNPAPAYIIEAARRRAAEAPRFVVDSPQWRRLAAIWAAIPVPPATAAEPAPVTGDGNRIPPATCGDTA